MTVLLVRVGADQSDAGGSWNGPVDGSTGRFVYVPIPEGREVHKGLERPYASVAPALASFGLELPAQLRARGMHLDPDFEQLTYGDRGDRAKQIRDRLGTDDLVVFYAGLAETHRPRPLVYALIGLLVVEEILPALEVPVGHRNCNAHSRRVLDAAATDIVVRGRPEGSGRLERCLPIGEYRDGAYRVRRDLLEEWGGLSVKDGYLQRSGRLPRFLDEERFVAWLERQGSRLLRANNEDRYALNVPPLN
jgi:hypothetical protein